MPLQAVIDCNRNGNILMAITLVLIAETRSNFISALQKNYNTIVVRSGKQAINMATTIRLAVLTSNKAGNVNAPPAGNNTE